MSVKAYQFPTRTSRGKKVDAVQPMLKTAKADSATVLGSSMEDWCYRALLALGWKEDDIRVQQSIYGGRNFPGGQVVDIILYKPTSCAISLKGEYWHGNPDEETIDDAMVAKQFQEYVVIWWREAFTYEMMYQVCLERIGRP